MYLLYADERAGQQRERQMDVGSLFVPDFEPPVAVHPTLRSFDYPAVLSELLAAFFSLAGDPRLDAAPPQHRAVRFVVVSLVSVQLPWPKARSASPARAHIGDGIHRRFQHFAVRNVRSRQHQAQRRSLRVYNRVPVRALLATVGRIRTSGFTAPFFVSGAGTVAESQEARDQSIFLVASSLSSMTACNASRLPVPQPAPASHSRAAVHLGGQVLPRQPSQQNEHDASEDRAVIYPGSSALRLGRMQR